MDTSLTGRSGSGVVPLFMAITSPLTTPDELPPGDGVAYIFAVQNRGIS
jgi:hypothetical protein